MTKDDPNFEPVYDPPRLHRRTRSSGALLFWAGVLCMVAGVWILGTWNSTWWVNTYVPAAMTIVAGALLLIDVLHGRRK